MTDHKKQPVIQALPAKSPDWFTTKGLVPPSAWNKIGTSGSQPVWELGSDEENHKNRIAYIYAIDNEQQNPGGQPKKKQSGKKLLTTSVFPKDNDRPDTAKTVVQYPHPEKLNIKINELKNLLCKNSKTGGRRKKRTKRKYKKKRRYKKKRTKKKKRKYKKKRTKKKSLRK